MEGLMLWLVSIAVAVCLMCALWACIWGCRKTEPKNELLGLAGMVKLTNPDEAFSQNGQWPGPNSTAVPTTSDAQSNKRCPTSANRSLPDLPVDVSHLRHPDGSVIWESQEVGGDTGSELYATVEENARPGTQSRSKKVVPRDLSSESKEESESTREGTSPVSQPNVLDDDGFPTYARLRKEHPYDKLKKSAEHPYAQVRPPSSREPDAEQMPSDRSDVSDPVPPPRTRKSLSHGSLTPPQAAVSSGVNGGGAESPRSLHSSHLQCSPQGSTSDIGAAVAISGRVSANQDLPYMTPPVASSQTQTVQHFSGDSQDSSKGYTSISVREPLANIRQQRPHDSHYATVSDDSDEMYAAIEDPSQVYTSGSETYAQIQPLALVSLPTFTPHPPPPADMVDSEEVTSIATQTVQSGPMVVPLLQGVHAPQPPSVDSLKHVAQAHSRQASSSSAASSVVNLGSPKPEKRPANSPLPPPPANLASPEGGCSLEDMYAKVVKKKRGSSEEADGKSQDTDSPKSQPSSPQRRFSTPLPLETVPVCNDPGYETVSATEAMVQEKVEQVPGYETVRKSAALDIDPNYEELQVDGMDPGYAHIRMRSGNKEPKYAKLAQEQAAGKQECLEEPDYASISRGQNQKVPAERKVASREDGDDPGYEQVRMQKENILAEDSDQDNPGYERVHARNSETKKTAVLDQDPGYEQVRLAGASKVCSVSDQDYEGVTLNQLDPNYETVHNEEPNYESVQYCNNLTSVENSSKNFDQSDEASNPLLGSN